MNYTYDILVNFKEQLWDFYDWNIDDKFIHIRKMPIFKLKTSDFINLAVSKVVISEEFLLKIFNKTEVLSGRKTTPIGYACIFTDGFDVIAVRFNKNGQTILKSKLLPCEDEEIIEFGKTILISNIDYKIVKKYQKNFKTREETSIYNYIANELKKLNQSGEMEKLEYLYFECFSKKCRNENYIIKEIKRNLSKNNLYLKVYDFLKMTANQ